MKTAFIFNILSLVTKFAHECFQVLTIHFASQSIEQEVNEESKEEDDAINN